MSVLRSGSLPLLVVALVCAPVMWAYPSGLAWWRTMAIVSGWLGWGLLLASLLLMIREARLAACLGGLSRMYAWHHRLGVAAYVVLLFHPLALAANGWQEAPGLAWAELSPVQLRWAGWLGWLALLAMMGGLAVTFANAVAYRTWRWLHHLLSLAVVLGTAHLFALGLNYPMLLTPLLAIGLIAWRLLRSDWGWASQPYQVSRVSSQGKGMIEVDLTPLTPGLAIHPGQFVLAAFFDGPRFRGCGEFHPFTASGVGIDGRFSLGIKALGDCTRHLQAVEPGVAVRVQGPFGNFFEETSPRPQFWLAGGIGITPFMGRLRGGTMERPVHLLYLHRNEGDAAYAAELRELAAAQPTLRLQEVSSGDGLPDLAELLPPAGELESCDCYLCGPPGMIAAAVKSLLARGVATERIHFERFDFR